MSEKESGVGVNLKDTPNISAKVNANGIVLFPQPSDDHRDPLNWPASKKISSLFIICLASFAGTVQALANGSGFHPQAELYGNSEEDISYSISAAVAGLAVGPLFWTPVARIYGKCACLFWTMFMTLVMNIWSAEMTRSSEYIPFVVSRFFAAVCGSAATVLGADFITEMFFLHDRGKCFAIYTSSLLLGTFASGTFSGFIVESTSWPVQFWYNVGLEAVICILCVLFLEETVWTRPGGEEYPTPPTSYVQRRLATFLYSKSRMPQRARKDVKALLLTPSYIALSPVTIVAGISLMIYFAFSVAVTTELSIFLQSPEDEGGYGFSAGRNAAFTFTQWFGVFAAQIYGFFVNDRLPLAICTRRGGDWKPEYRLHSLWVPVLITYPIGLGLFGACLYYHWHYMVLALAVFLVTASAVAGTPACINYIVEAFSPRVATEATATLNFYRLIFAFTIPFFIFPWADKVGLQWVFGIMAFMTVFAFCLILVVIYYGSRLRAMNLSSDVMSSKRPPMRLVQELDQTGA